MKSMFLLVGLSTMACGIANANSVFIACTPLGGTITLGGGVGTSGTSADSCPGFTPPSGVLTSVELWYTADWQFGLTSGLNTVVTTATPSGSWSPSTGVCTTTGTGGNSSTGSCTFSGTIGPQNVESTETTPLTSGFLVSITAMITTGNVSTSSYGEIVEYDYGASSPTPTPEPASFILLVGGLLLMGTPVKRAVRANRSRHFDATMGIRV